MLYVIFLFNFLKNKQRIEKKMKPRKKILNLLLHAARRTTIEKKKLGRWV
jgi:hypothetical protein